MNTPIKLDHISLKRAIEVDFAARQKCRLWGCQLFEDKDGLEICVRCGFHARKPNSYFGLASLACGTHIEEQN